MRIRSERVPFQNPVYVEEVLRCGAEELRRMYEYSQFVRESAKAINRIHPRILQRRSGKQQAWSLVMTPYS